MALTDINGINGAVTLPSTHGGAAYAFNISKAQKEKETSRFGQGNFTSQRYGLITLSGTVNIFATKGATGTPMGLTALEADGATLTLQADTGVTLSGVANFGGTLNVDVKDPACEGTYPFKSNGTWVEAWATA